jgi:hypothetical protein
MAIGNLLSEKGWFYDVPGHPVLIAAQDIMMEELSAAGADEIDAATAVNKMADRIRKAMGE